MLFLNVLTIIIVGAITIIHAWLMCGDMTTIISRSAPEIPKEFIDNMEEHKKEPNKFFCDFCGAEINPRHWAPLIGFIRIRGRATCCGKKVPRFYFIAEVLNFIGLSLVLAFLWNRPLIAIAAIAAFYIPLALILCAIKYKFRFKLLTTSIYLLRVLAHKLFFIGLGLWIIIDFGPLF
ncbi:MAG: prepilin peptidase [Firmicutes bacterium]|nr:prepilin peptidase [Bacillota bacterium]